MQYYGKYDSQMILSIQRAPMVYSHGGTMVTG
ncbi:MAG: hypothetical protein J07HQW1_00063, partial [Haloquadratum walsbyi J07HQW1]